MLRLVLMICSIATVGWAWPASAAVLGERPVQLDLSIESRADWSVGEKEGSDRGQRGLVAEIGLTTRLADPLSLEVAAALEELSTERSSETIRSLERLALRFGHRDVALLVGRLSSRFGAAWRWHEGIYAADLVEDYELSNRWGIAAEWALPDELAGGAAFSVEFLSADPESFPGSTPAARRFLPRSVVAAVSGSLVRGFEYHAAYLQQLSAPEGLARERGLSIGLLKRFEGTLASATLFGEFARLENAFGERGTTDYVTAGLSLARWDTELSLSGSVRIPRMSRGERTRAHLFEATLSRSVGGGARLSLGAKLADDGRAESATVGLRVEWSWESVEAS